jgi:hypothetical protein
MKKLKFIALLVTYNITFFWIALAVCVAFSTGDLNTMTADVIRLSVLCSLIFSSIFSAFLMSVDEDYINYDNV